MKKVKAPLENCIKFSVNEDKKTVTCIIKTYPLYEVPFDNLLQYGDDITVVGIAKCSPNDEFNETTGRRIAESRAKAELFRKLRDFTQGLADKTQIALENYELRVLELQRLINKEKEHIENLVK